MDKRKSFFDMYKWYNSNQIVEIYLWEKEIKEDKNILIDMAFGC